MKRTLALAAFCLIPLLQAGPARAQTCDTGSYGGCAEASVETCQTANANCQDAVVAFTLEAVKAEAVAECCSRNSRRNRRRCLRNQQTRYNQARGRARGLDIRQFLQAARDEVRALRNDDCGNGVYQQLF